MGWDSALFAELIINAFSLSWIIVPALLLGILVGAIPGFSAQNTLIILLPLTLAMDINVALAFMVSLYCATHLGGGIPAMEMTKWFDTNYHYIVPELTKDQQFTLAGDAPVRYFQEAAAIGITTKPVLLGPVSFLLLAKPRGDAFSTLELLPRLLPVYEELLRKLQEVGARWVQLDEPVLVQNPS